MTLEILIWPMAIGLIFLGVFATVAPSVASRAFGITSETPWVAVAGVRDIFLGLAFLLAWHHGSRVLVGELCFAAVVVPLVDSWVTRRAGNWKASLAHLGGAVAIAVFGALLVWTEW